LGETVYANIGNNTDGIQYLIWNNRERPELVSMQLINRQIIPFLDYTFDQTLSGYEMWVNPTTTSLIFKLSPTQTTVYTGTLQGLDFAIKVNVVNNHIAAIDTAICRGQSIDLKALERIENINGISSWNVTNTLVTPMVDTKYVVYGIAKDKCPEQGDYTITHEVTVYVDENIWSDGGALVATCAGDLIDLTDALNTNARKLYWYDANDNELPDGIVRVGIDDTFYRVEMRNGCGTKTDTVKVNVVDECLKYYFAQNDTLVQNHCFDSPIASIRMGAYVLPLDNDNYPCDNPVVTIITPPTNPDATVSYSVFNKQLSYRFTNTSGPIIDSVQYEVCCSFKCATAWAYFDIRDEKLELIDIEVTSTEIILSLTGGNSNAIVLFYAVNESATFMEQSYMTSFAFEDTTKYTFSNGSVLENGKYYIGVWDMSSARG
jgi:hypothetical protein